VHDKEEIMKAILRTYVKEDRFIDDNVIIDDDYDGNPYGDKVPFTVRSNQMIITEEQ